MNPQKDIRLMGEEIYLLNRSRANMLMNPWDESQGEYTPSQIDRILEELFALWRKQEKNDVNQALIKKVMELISKLLELCLTCQEEQELNDTVDQFMKIAAIQGLLEFLLFLKKNGFRMEEALHSAAKHGQLEVIELLVHSGHGPNCRKLQLFEDGGGDHFGVENAFEVATPEAKILLSQFYPEIAFQVALQVKDYDEMDRLINCKFVTEHDLNLALLGTKKGSEEWKFLKSRGAVEIQVE
jgi:hypothetical protein